MVMTDDDIVDGDGDLRLVSSPHCHSHLRAFAPDGEKLALHHDRDKLVEKCDVVASVESVPNSQEAQCCRLVKELMLSLNESLGPERSFCCPRT